MQKETQTETGNTVPDDAVVTWKQTIYFEEVQTKNL